MLSRTIVRLLFKATLSVAMLLGIASYGLYLSGGDPKAVWQRVASGAIDSAGESLGAVGARVSAPVDALTGSDSRAAQVWTWRDEHGLVHYASTRPAGVAATAVGVDPDVNVLAPVRTRASTGPSDSSDPSGGGDALLRASGRPPVGATLDGASGAGGSVSASRGGDELDEPLPGIGGVIARARGDTPDPARAEALLRMLQMPSPRSPADRLSPP